MLCLFAIVFSIPICVNTLIEAMVIKWNRCALNTIEKRTKYFFVCIFCGKYGHALYLQFLDIHFHSPNQYFDRRISGLLVFERKKKTQICSLNNSIRLRRINIEFFLKMNTKQLSRTNITCIFSIWLIFCFDK